MSGRKRPNIEIVPDPHGDSHQFYTPDVRAIVMDDVVFQSSPALQWEYGGLSDNDSVLPSRKSIPSYDAEYKKQQQQQLADDDSAVFDMSELRTLCDKAIKEDTRLQPAPPQRTRAPPLRASMVDTDLFLDGEKAPRGNGSPGQGWTRGPVSGWLLPGESRARLRPVETVSEYRTEGSRQPALSNEEKKIIAQDLVPNMKKQWPCPLIDAEVAVSVRYALYNGYSFFNGYLKDWLVRRASAESLRQVPASATKNATPVHALLIKLRDKDPQHELKRAVWQSMTSQLNDVTIRDRGLGYAIALAQHLHVVESEIRRIGRVARENAVWVRVVACPAAAVEVLEGRVIAETQRIAHIGVQQGAFKGDQVALVDNTWSRIERPASGDKRISSLLIWEAETDDDFTPTMEKVVAGIIYNAEVLADLTTEFQINRDCDRHAQTIDTLLSHTGIGRGVIDNGGTVKMAEGTHEINGQLQSAPFAADIPKSILDQATFRREYDKRRDISQLWAFQLMAAFLPHFAESQMNKCRGTGLLGPLGTPAYACFGSWGYFSSSHVDADDGATHADVTERGTQVKPDSSNFYLTKFKLIIELAHHARWFWEAAKAPHGTTLCYPSVAYPGKWKTFVRHDHLRQTGQITSAFVTTKSQHSAAERRFV